MKLKQRIMSLCLTVIMLAGMISAAGYTVIADASSTEPSITVSTATAAPGDEVQLTAIITNNPGILGMTLRLHYDESLATLTRVENGGALSGMTFTTPKALHDGINLPWDSEMVDPDTVSDGVVLTMTFTVFEKAASGELIEVSLSYDKGAIIDDMMSPIPVVMIAGGITISGETETAEPELICEHQLVKTETVPAKCAKDGCEAYWACSKCNKVFADADAITEVTDMTTLVIPALGHSWDKGVITTEPTMTAEGVKTFTCTRCGTTKTEAVPKIEEIPEDAGRFVIETVKSSPGSTVVMNVFIENNPGFSAASIQVVYDNAIMILTGIELQPAFAAGAFSSVSQNYLTFVRTEDIDSDDLFCVLTFTINPDADECDTVVSIHYDDGCITKNDESVVEMFVVDGCMQVRNYMPGDINGDFKVTTADLTRLLKYLNHENVVVVEAALDVNGDGKVTTADLTRLLKYLNHEDVEIF